MKVKCLANTLSETQKVQHGFKENVSPKYKLTIGETYVVLGMNFQTNAETNNGVTLLLRNDIGGCSFVPLCLLSISDPRVSAHWLGKLSDNQNLRLWPKEFLLRDFFHDDLSNGIPEIVGIFDNICARLENEFIDKINGVGLD